MSPALRAGLLLGGSLACACGTPAPDCVPATCAALGACGSTADGCGAELDCDLCPVAFTAPRLVESGAAGTTQREPALAIDSGGDLWLAYVDFPSPGVNRPRVRFTTSTDGGQRFSPSIELCDPCADPVIAIDAFDRVFASYLGWGPPRAVVVRRIDDLPDNRGDPVVVNDPSHPHVDREWMAVGPGGEVYVTWNAGGGPDSALYLAKSVDHGASFGPGTLIALPDGPDETIVYGAVSAGPLGVVDVAYPQGVLDATASTVLTDRISFVRSADGGGTFGDPVTLAARRQVPVPGELGGLQAVWLGFPSVVTGPDGSVHVTWAMQRTGAPEATDIVVSTSPDGRTFSPPVRASDDGAPGLRTMPCSALGTDGRLHLSWIDSRHFAGDPARLWSVYYASSVDGGGTFQADEQITAQPFTGDPGERVDYAIGEFNVIDARGDRVYMAWSSARGPDADGPDVDVFLAAGRVAP